MNNLKLNITDQAKSDIQLITTYIAKDNRTAAKKMAVCLYDACVKLAKYPELGTLRPDFTYKNYRFYIVRKHYIIAYKVENDNLYISRVLATYQDICALF